MKKSNFLILSVSMIALFYPAMSDAFMMRGFEGGRFEAPMAPHVGTPMMEKSPFLGGAPAPFIQQGQEIPQTPAESQAPRPLVSPPHVIEVPRTYSSPSLPQTFERPRAEEIPPPPREVMPPKVIEIPHEFIQPHGFTPQIMPQTTPEKPTATWPVSPHLTPFLSPLGKEVIPAKPEGTPTLGIPPQARQGVGKEVPAEGLPPSSPGISQAIPGKGTPPESATNIPPPEKPSRAPSIPASPALPGFPGGGQPSQGKQTILPPTFPETPASTQPLPQVGAPVVSAPQLPLSALTGGKTFIAPEPNVKFSKDFFWKPWIHRDHRRHFPPENIISNFIFIYPYYEYAPIYYPAPYYVEPYPIEPYAEGPSYGETIYEEPYYNEEPYTPEETLYGEEMAPMEQPTQLYFQEETTPDQQQMLLELQNLFQQMVIFNPGQFYTIVGLPTPESLGLE